MSKYDTVEWRKSPIRAQIREALKEIEEVKAAWQALERIADSLEAYHQAALERRREWLSDPRRNKDLGVAGIAREGIAMMGEQNVSAAGRRLAETELKQLDGWMLSLCESEMGLRAMMTEGVISADWFLARRHMDLSRQATKWRYMREMTIYGKGSV